MLHALLRLPGRGVRNGVRAVGFQLSLMVGGGAEHLVNPCRRGTPTAHVTAGVACALAALLALRLPGSRDEQDPVGGALHPSHD